MDQLQLPHAKLFYYSAQLYANGEITENEKIRLKEMVINDEPDVFDVLERYLRSQNLDTLKKNLFGLLRPHEKHLYEVPEEVVQNQVQQQQQQQQQIEQQQQELQQQNQQQQESVQQNSQQVDIAQNGSFGQSLNGNGTVNSLFQQQPANPSNQNDIDYKDKDYTDQLQAKAEWINQNPNIPDEISSPLGLQLLKRKKKQIKKKHQKSEHFKPFQVDVQ